MEVKYNVSAFDNTPVTASPEVHTGRAVFVDEDLYEKDTSYKAKVDKCIEEGFHRVVEGESGGSGGSGGGTASFLVLKVVSQEQTTEPCPNDASKSIYITTTTLNHTWQEIFDAMNADTPVFYVREPHGEPIWHFVGIAYSDGSAYDIVLDDGTPLQFDSPTSKTVVSRDDSECSGKV